MGRKLLRYFVYGIYGFAIIYLVFIGGNEYRYSNIFALRSSANFIPLRAKIESFASGDIWIQNNFKQFLKDLIGNLLLFFPLPLLLMLGEGIRSKRKAILITLVISFTIELLQYLLNIGIGDIDDVLLNTTGAALSACLARWIQQQKYWPGMQSFLNLPA